MCVRARVLKEIKGKKMADQRENLRHLYLILE